MSAAELTTATLRFFGDELDPKYITGVLGAVPSEAWTKGDIWITGGRELKRKTGSWLYKVKDRSPGDLDGQIVEMFGSLTDNLSVWQHLTETYTVSVFGGVFMATSNEGMSLRPETMMLIGQRSVEIWLDIYGPSDD